MIISRTPLRISFAGGGTDFARYYREHEGAVVSAAIDKYVYVVVVPRFDELIIVNRGKPTRRFLEPRYTANCVFVPYAGLTSFSLVRPPADRPGRFCELALRLDKQVIRQSCLVAPERVVERLATHHVPQTSA